MNIKYFHFNHFGADSIVVKFYCDVCSHPVISEEIDVPSPNYAADTASQSQTDNEGYAICEKCEKQFDIDIYVTFAGGDGNINDLPESHEVTVDVIEEPYYEDHYEAISANTEFFNTFNTELDDLNSLLAIEPRDEKLKKLFCRQLFSSIIGTMETYLSDAFVNTVLREEKMLRKFFETFKGFDKQNITMSSAFDFHEKAESIAKKVMLDVIYHNLPKVSGMYRDTLGIKFPDFGNIYKAVLTRHDLVHRNGKTKKGTEVIINAELVTVTIEEVLVFIMEIDEQLRA